ncbi:MAG: LysE family translocator [Moraxellaceae bacterium]|nr:LysE family translocator [Moraxellaceae bacterium]
MDLITLVYFVLSSMLVAMLPGPAMMLVIQSSIDKGIQRGLAVTFGILFADSVLLLCICLGLGKLLTSSPTIVLVMNVVTSTYLLYLGGKTIYAIRYIKQNDIENIEELTWKNGFLITLVNPKTIIFLLAYFPQFIQKNANVSELTQLLILSLLFLLSVAVVMCVYAFLANFVRHHLLKVKIRIFINLLFAVLLIAIGLHNLWTVL